MENILKIKRKALNLFLVVNRPYVHRKVYGKVLFKFFLLKNIRNFHFQTELIHQI
jgi:hypothetical protein